MALYAIAVDGTQILGYGMNGWPVSMGSPARVSG